VAAGEESEGDPPITSVHELNARQQLALFAGDDRVLDRALAELVDDDHTEGDQPGAKPGAREDGHAA
jgi:hypothetical protein